jgi:hypothetical protein
MSNKERYFKESVCAVYMVLGTIGIMSLGKDSSVIKYIIYTVFALVMYWRSVTEIVSLVQKSIQNDYFDEDNDFEERTKKSGTNIPNPSKRPPMPSTGAKAPPFRRMTDPPMPRKTKPLEPLAPKR